MNDKALSIIIKAQDEASATLAKVSAEVERAGRATEVAAGKTSLFSAANVKMGAVIGAVAGLVSNVASRAFQGLSDVIGDAVKRVDTLNNFPRIMSNFGVSAQDATKMITDLDKGVRGLPTSLNDIATLAEGFVPLTKNTEMATKTALALNNAILAGGAPAQVQAAALEQFRQALAKGVPDLQDWKSLETAMPAQLQQVNDKLGIGKGVLKDYTNNGLGLYNAMKDGKLSMDDFNRALVNLNTQGINGLPNFATQAKNATQGIATGFTNAKTAVTRGIADIMQAIGTQNISGALTNLGKGLESGLKTIAQWIPIVRNGLSELADKAKTLLGPSFEALWGTITNKLMPALEHFWKNVVQPLVPVIGALLGGAIWVTINALNFLFKALTPVLNFMSDHTWLVYGLATAFGVLATSMALTKAFNAITIGFNIFKLVTIPSAMASMGAFKALVTSPMTMGTIAVAGAIADIFLVKKAIDTVHQAINDMNAAAKSAASAKASQASAHATLVDLVKNGTPAQKARAQYEIMAGYASGGYTGAGGVNQVAGLVHKGEYVLPQSAVNQDTGLPKNMGSTNNFYGNIVLSSPDAVDRFADRFEMAAYGAGV